MKGRFFESDFQEAQTNFEWIKNLTTVLQHEVPYDGHWPGPGPAPVLDGPVEDARLRVAVALGLGPIEVLPMAGEGDLLAVDRLALRIRERLTGDPAEANVQTLESRYYTKVPAGSEELPVDKASLRGKLPEGFPGKAALEEAGIATYGQVRKVKDYTAIPNIGDATAEKIRDALGINQTLEPGAPGPSTGTSNSGVDEGQVVDDEGGDEDIQSATETAPL